MIEEEGKSDEEHPDEDSGAARGGEGSLLSTPSRKRGRVTACVGQGAPLSPRGSRGGHCHSLEGSSQAGSHPEEYVRQTLKLSFDE